MEHRLSWLRPCRVGRAARGGRSFPPGVLTHCWKGDLLSTADSPVSRRDGEE